MNLMDALAVTRGDTVAFTGAGGKTRTMARLAGELAALGWRVLVTTTTRIAIDELALFNASYCDETQGVALAPLLKEKRALFWYSRIAGDKVYGVSSEQVSELRRHAHADVLLIEADGSRRLPIKAPYPHEPVVPPETTLVVNLVGYSAFGELLDDVHAYNALGLAEKSGAAYGSRIDERVIASALMVGATEYAAPGRRFVSLLNAVNATERDREMALHIAQLTLSQADVERVVLGSFGEGDQVSYEVRRRVCAIVLAAGQSKRMGQQKLLLPWREGETVVDYVIKTTRAGGIEEVLVITGADAGTVGQRARENCAVPLHNPDFAAGEMLSSLQTGLRAALNQNAAAALIVLGDQPSMHSDVIRRILDAYAQGRGTIIAPSHQMRRGHPILIDRVYWNELLDLPPGSAPRDVINRHADQIGYVEADDSVLRDIDTPEAYAEERRRMFYDR